MKINVTAFLLAATAMLLSVESALAKSTLMDVYLDAVDNDPEIRAEYALYQAQISNQDKTSGNLLPSVILTGEIARNREDVETGSGATGTSGLTYFDSNLLALTIKQPLYRKDIFSDIDIQQAKTRVAEYEYRNAEHEFIMRIVQRYLAVLASRNELHYLNTEKNAINEQLANTKKRYKAGINTNADLYEAQATFDLAAAQVIVAETNIFDANAALEEVTNKTYVDITDLQHNFKPVYDGPADIAHWIETANDKNPELIASRYRVESLRYELERASAGHYPKLDLVAKYSNEDTGGRFGESETDDQSISLQLEFPIYEGGKVSAGIRESNSRLNAEQEYFTRTHRLVKREISKAFKSVSSTVNRVNALEQAVKSADAALSAIKSGYKAGSRTSSDVLDAQKELFKARRDHFQEQYKYVVSYLKLKQLAGTLSSDDVKHVTSWFK